MTGFFIRHGGIILLNAITVFNFMLMTLAKKTATYPTFLFIVLIDIAYCVFAAANAPKKPE